MLQTLEYTLQLFALGLITMMTVGIVGVFYGIMRGE